MRSALRLLGITLGLAVVGSILSIFTLPGSAANADEAEQKDRPGVLASCASKPTELCGLPTKFSVATGSNRSAAVNAELRKQGYPELPSGPGCRFTAHEIYRDGSSRFECQNIAGSPGIMWDGFLPDGFWGGAWKAAKCSAAVVVAVVPITKAYKIVKAKGGIKETAKVIYGAGSWGKLKKTAPDLAVEILGIAAIENECF